MRVETVQDAIEGAPAVIYPDGEGGVVFALVTDEAVVAVVKELCEENGWTEEEQSNLYRAVLAALGRFADPDANAIDHGVSPEVTG